MEKCLETAPKGPFGGDGVPLQGLLRGIRQQLGHLQQAAAIEDRHIALLRPFAGRFRARFRGISSFFLRFRWVFPRFLGPNLVFLHHEAHQSVAHGS